LTKWRLIILKPAERYLKRLSSEHQARIIRALKLLQQDRNLVDIKSLQGRPEWRLRVGNYRILFVIDPENKIYTVTLIKPRGDVYK
jgi:mRNA interferase RelE/StbE